MTKLERIKIVMEYYQSRGYNSERINKIYFKILKDGEKS